MTCRLMKRSSFRKLSYVPGLPVGHVPRGLGGCFSKILDENGNIWAKVTDVPTQIFPLWHAPNKKGFGSVMPCTYITSKKNLLTKPCQWTGLKHLHSISSPFQNSLK